MPPPYCIDLPKNRGNIRSWHTLSGMFATKCISNDVQRIAVSLMKGGGGQHSSRSGILWWSITCYIFLHCV